MEQERTGTFNRCSAPSELKITDIRFTDVIGAPMHCTLMKIYTNQGITGLGIEDYNDEVLREHLHPDYPELWAETSRWNRSWSHDRLWS